MATYDDTQFDDLIRGLKSPNFQVNAGSIEDLFEDDKDTDIKGLKSQKVDKIDDDDPIVDPPIDDDTDDIIDDKDDKTKIVKTTDEPLTDLEELDPIIAKYTREKLEDKIGYDIGDVESFDEIVDRLAEIVQEGSQPEYANDDLAAMDKFVRDGGDLKKFYAELYDGRVDTEEIDLKEEGDQKRIIKQSLKDSGYTDVQIKRKLERYEESGVLEEEAEEALELVKEYNERNKKKLLKEQENFRQQEEKRNQKFVSDVQSGINSLKEIGGIPVSERDKKDLLNFIFRVDKDGLTPYQRKYSSDIKHLIKSAYFTLNEDVIFEKAASKGASNLAKELKEKLAQKGKRNKSSVSQSDDSGVDALEVFSRQLRKF